MKVIADACRARAARLRLISAKPKQTAKSNNPLAKPSVANSSTHIDELEVTNTSQKHRDGGDEAPSRDPHRLGM
jgi:hypothetical protein